MSLKSFLAKPFAHFIVNRLNKDAANAVAIQERILKRLVRKATSTQFGKDHQFNTINNYADFKKQVPVRDYEALKPYVERVVEGEEDVLWPGKPLYFAKTSGTTSGTKYIPISKDSISSHIHAARNALLCYIHETGNASFMNGNMIFLSGSPEMEKKNGILTGRLSGIVNHHVPAYLRKNQLPSYQTNCMEDWEQKVDAIVEETHQRNMTLISGIPPWVQMYFDRLQNKTGKKIKDLFPNFSLFVQGGVNFEPYRDKLEASIGKHIDTIETYPASEGFIAFQNSQKEKGLPAGQAGLLLNINAGIFFEFIPTEEFFNENPTRLSLDKVEIGKNYAIILNTNAGLWGYNIGDTVKFVSINPYKILVTGRIKHFISAFGEHVIAEEVEASILKTAKEEKVDIVEFTVAPQVQTTGELPYHEWFIEFGNQPKDMEKFAAKIDNRLQEKNSYYKDLIQGNILQQLKISVMQKGAFIHYMKSKGKLGGQNKVPRLSNDRTIADELAAYKSIVNI